ncbi:autophagy-related protein 27 [Schizothecium vesticola]|uniref:Autophagy-related protein 27 n=1 Tax=Schizothecium vesticola TaxID=314040 RepID=A0AA40EJR0_9PEZI|nr:autophagy-related protein 27 [Schizothecium vesticola]
MPHLRNGPWALLAALLAATATAAAATDTTALLPCAKLPVDNHVYDLSPLAGPHTLVTTEFAPPSHYNTTWAVDLCKPLVRKDKGGEGDDKGFRCPEGTSVCAIKHHWDPASKKSEVEVVVPIAGALEGDAGGGKKFAWEAKALGGEADEGFKLTLRGGVFEGREQKAVVEMRCNKTMTGLEGEVKGEEEYVKGKREEGGGGVPEKQVGDGVALVWEGYKREGEGDTLFLTWHTKYACKEAVPGETPPPPVAGDAGWGFFTWMIILVFLAVAAYLIFGSWLNYNRYGARGWDLLPHSDTLRDIPYLLKDWIRRVLNTVQSSGSRGGYSAV